LPRRAPANEKARSEFGSKISRERIGREVGCNSTQNPCSSSEKNPVKAMCNIRDLGLFYVVFSFSENSNPPVFDKCDWYVLVLTSEFFTFSVIFQDPVVTCTLYLCPLSSLL
jgi:hypothetical protein